MLLFINTYNILFSTLCWLVILFVYYHSIILYHLFVTIIYYVVIAIILILVLAIILTLVLSICNSFYLLLGFYIKFIIVSLFYSFYLLYGFYSFYSLITFYNFNNNSFYYSINNFYVYKFKFNYSTFYTIKYTHIKPTDPNYIPNKFTVPTKHVSLLSQLPSELITITGPNNTPKLTTVDSFISIISTHVKHSISSIPSNSSTNSNISNSNSNSNSVSDSSIHSNISNSNISNSNNSNISKLPKTLLERDYQDIQSKLNTNQITIPNTPNFNNIIPNKPNIWFIRGKIPFHLYLIPKFIKPSIPNRPNTTQHNNYSTSINSYTSLHYNSYNSTFNSYNTINLYFINFNFNFYNNRIILFLKRIILWLLKHILNDPVLYSGYSLIVSGFIMVHYELHFLGFICSLITCCILYAILFHYFEHLIDDDEYSKILKEQQQSNTNKSNNSTNTSGSTNFNNSNNNTNNTNNTNNSNNNNSNSSFILILFILPTSSLISLISLISLFSILFLILMVLFIILSSTNYTSFYPTSFYTSITSFYYFSHFSFYYTILDSDSLFNYCILTFITVIFLLWFKFIISVHCILAGIQHVKYYYFYVYYFYYYHYYYYFKLLYGILSMVLASDLISFMLYIWMSWTFVLFMLYLVKVISFILLSLSTLYTLYFIGTFCYTLCYTLCYLHYCNTR